ncbi:MAG: zinc-binding dehydrogenase, partial [Pseudomonadota bacterium]
IRCARRKGSAHRPLLPRRDSAKPTVRLQLPVDDQWGSQQLYNAQGGYGQAGRAFGTAAEFVSLPADTAVSLVETLSFEEGACLGIPAMTAFHAVFADGPVAGKTVLVAGAGGAVGHFAVQFAVSGGARVFRTAGNANRIAGAIGAGADKVYCRHSEDLLSQLIEASEGQGFDRIIEVDLGANLEIDVTLLKQGGVIASYSSSSDPSPILPYYKLQNKAGAIRTIQGFSLSSEVRARGQHAIAELSKSGKLDVAVGQRFQLEDIADAHEAVEAAQTIGNVVLMID